jgi:hypothetical protein
MSKMINGSSGTFSSSVAGLLVYLKLAGALETPIILQAWQGKCISYCEFNCHRGGGYISALKQRNNMVPLHRSAHLENILRALACAAATHLLSSQQWRKTRRWKYASIPPIHGWQCSHCARDGLTCYARLIMFAIPKGLFPFSLIKKNRPSIF